jgi:hypothetical protein
MLSSSSAKAKPCDTTARARGKDAVVILMKRDGGISATGTNWKGSAKYGGTENL